MVTIAHLVARDIADKPILQEYLRRGIINFAALAEDMLPRIEKQLGKKASQPAIMMAIRRYADTLGPAKATIGARSSEILLKSNLMDITVRRSPSLFRKLLAMYSLAKYEEGDTLNVVHGNYEASIILSEHHAEKCLAMLKDEGVLKVDRGLVSVSLRFGPAFRSTPGVIARITSRLAAEGVNVLEVVSTNTELAIILRGQDATRAYAVLEEYR